LTTLFGNAAVTATATTTIIPAVPVQRKKHNMLPVLVVLFLISYGLMTMLIIEQGRTIESQRALIHELYHDSAELAAVRSRTLQESAVVDMQHALTTQAPSSVTPSSQIPSTQNSSNQTQTPSTQAHVPATHAPSTQIPSTQIPSTQIPSTQVQSSKTPSTQVAPRGRVKNRGAKMPEPQFQAPSRPSADLADERRALRTI
jgi:cytoskeletal protein RodZ